MQDTNWKTWFLIFLLVLGVSFELLKRAPSGPGVDWVRETLNVSPTQPYSIKGAMAAKRPSPPDFLPPTTTGTSTVDREQLAHFLAENKQQETTFENKDKGGEGKLEKKKDDDEWEEVIDPKTGKKMKRKKKKKKTEPKKEEPKQEDVVENKPEETEPENDIDSDMSDAIATGAVPPTRLQPRPADTPFEGYEYWAKLLLNEPNLEDTKRFIEHYRTSLVTADIFYRIVSEMIEDPRATMQQLGVMCAGLTPSVNSFLLLAKISETQKSDSKVRQGAEQFLGYYGGSLSYLSVLERILRAPSASYTTVLATQKLDQLASRYLNIKPKTPTSGQSTTTPATPQYASHFRRFVAILTALTRSRDNTVQSQAQRSLTNLQALLTPTGTTPTTPTTPSTPSTPGGAAAPPTSSQAQAF